MTDHIISQQSATGEEVTFIVDKIEPVLEGIPKGKVVIALLSMILVMMNPDINPMELQRGVKDVSQYICLMLEGTGLGEEGPVVLN